MDFATYQMAASGGEVYRVSSAARVPPPAARTPLHSPLPSAFPNLMMTPPNDVAKSHLAGEHQLDVNQGIRNTLNALRSTLGSQGAAIRGADNAVKSQQSDLARLCVGLADVQAAAAATSTELAGLRDSTAAADEAALAQVHRLHEGAEQQSRRRTAEAMKRLEALALMLADAEERAQVEAGAMERRLEALGSSLAQCVAAADVKKMELAKADAAPVQVELGSSELEARAIGAG